MKKILALLLLSLCTSFQATAQAISKKDLYGIWSAQTGLPGRTIQQSDSSSIHLMPVTYTTTTIKLKRFGRAIKETKSYHGVGFDSKYRAKWKVNGDTLTMHFKKSEENYFIDQSIEYRIFLNSLTAGNAIYGREE